MSSEEDQIRLTRLAVQAGVEVTIREFTEKVKAHWDDADQEEKDWLDSAKDAHLRDAPVPPKPPRKKPKDPKDKP